MLRAVVVATLLNAAACGRGDPAVPDCDRYGSQIIFSSSVERNDESVSLGGNFQIDVSNGGHSGIAAALLAGGSGTLRTTPVLHPDGRRAGFGYWLRNNSGSGEVVARVSTDGGSSWQAGESPQPNLGEGRPVWTYIESLFPLPDKRNAVIFELEITDYSDNGLWVDDLRVLDYDICEAEPLTDGELMVWVTPTATLNGFWIDQFEATVDLDSGLGSVDQSAGSNETDGSTVSIALVRQGALPRVSLSWHQARASCINAGKRLCTNLEFERACAGDDGRNYPYGDTRVAGRCSDSGATETGSYPECVSSFGVFDLVGNVQEWVDVTTDSDRVQSAGGDWGDDGTCSILENVFTYDLRTYRGFRCCRD